MPKANTRVIHYISLLMRIEAQGLISHFVGQIWSSVELNKTPFIILYVTFSALKLILMGLHEA